ncbi:MAG: glycosyltransferase family 2 protein [Methanobacteriaceae archaeon]|nr:glycosyltransferase family 2 protein [Methanobacteriaceae archaeon]
MTNNGISVVIHTYNEEKNIRNCLETVKWADEIVLVDMYSEDKTVEIAEKYTDKIFLHEKLGYIEPARKFAMKKTTNNWVLSVDADEMVPKALKDKLVDIMSENSADVVHIPHNNYFFGSLMEKTGWGALQDMHFRFFKKDWIELSDVIHGGLSLKENAKIYEIRNPNEGFIHFNYLDFEHFVEKMNRYTTIEAKTHFEDGKDITLKSLIKELYHEFKLRYITLNGRKEGFRGFSLSLLMVMYKLLYLNKLRLMREFNSKEPRTKIIEKYNKIAEYLIKEYEK